MPVVINEFEVLPAPQSAQGEAGAPGDDSPPGNREKIEPLSLEPALESLHILSLRTWAH